MFSTCESIAEKATLYKRRLSRTVVGTATAALAREGK